MTSPDPNDPSRWKLNDETKPPTRGPIPEWVLSRKYLQDHEYEIASFVMDLQRHFEQMEKRLDE